VIHGEGADGKVTYEFLNVDDANSYTAQRDDPQEGDGGSAWKSSSVEWQWGSRKTDGGAWRGILEAADGQFTIRQSAISGVQDLILIQPDPNRDGLQTLGEGDQGLNLNEDIDISRGGGGTESNISEE